MKKPQTRNTSLVGMECRCPQCGKTFIKPGDEWAYMARVKNGMRHFCSWGCLRKWQAAHTISGQLKKGDGDGADQQGGGD